jgi:hypothetical protein
MPRRPDHPLPPPPSICCHAARAYRTPSPFPSPQMTSALTIRGRRSPDHLFSLPRNTAPHCPEHPTSFSTTYDSASPAIGDPFSALVSVQAPPPSAIISEYDHAPSLLSNGSMPHSPSLVRSCRSTLGLSPAIAGPSPSAALRRAAIPFCLAIDRPRW